MKMELIIRFDYGHIITWVRRRDGGVEAIAGTDALILRTPWKREARICHSRGFFRRGGRSFPFVLTWVSVSRESSAAHSSGTRFATDGEFWTGGRRMPHAGTVARGRGSFAHHPEGAHLCAHGGIVAAATTSLPEDIGGVRNCDYGYCWLRDATFTLVALIDAGYLDEARSWREWLLRAGRGEGGPDADHVWLERGASSGGIRDRLVSGLRGLAAGALGNAPQNNFS